MRILFSAENFYPPKGGAELSVSLLLKKLNEKHEVTVVTPGEEEETIDWEGIDVHFKKIKINKIFNHFNYFTFFSKNKKWENVFRDFIREKKPDLIINQLILAPSIIRTAKQEGIKTITFIRSYEHFCPIGLLNGVLCHGKCYLCVPRTKLGYLIWLRNFLQYPFIKAFLEQNKKALAQSDMLISNSHYMAEVAEKKAGVKSEVAYPFIEVPKIKNGKDERYITFIKPYPNKGVSTFIELAKKMRGYNFLCAGEVPPISNLLLDIENTLKKLDNVNYIGRTKDMKSVYSQTRILLVPSIWPEPFGRVCVEAMANGIPCIVSNKGALPEVVGKAGIVIDNPLNTEEWIKAIKTLEDKEIYNKLSKAAVKQAKKFEFERQYKRFNKIMEELWK